MSFVVRHRSRARKELNACAERLGDAGLKFRAEVEAWLASLADEAEAGVYTKSEDAVEFLKKWSSISEDRIPKTGFDRWRAAGCREKILAFLAFLREWLRSPLQSPPSPWEFRMAMEVFEVPLPGSANPSLHSPCVVLALYEVDRLNRQIVITIYPELPVWPV